MYRHFGHCRTPSYARTATSTEAEMENHPSSRTTEITETMEKAATRARGGGGLIHPSILTS
jgi:hypothetical protein